VVYKWLLNSWGNDCITPTNSNSTSNNEFYVFLGSDRGNLGAICKCPNLSEGDLSSDSCYCNSSSLAPGQTYYWRVEANNGAKSSSSDIWQFYVCGQSSSPTAPQLSSPGDNAVINTPFTLLTWNHSSSWGSTCCSDGTVCNDASWPSCCPQRRYWLHYDTAGANTPAIAGLDAAQNSYNVLISAPNVVHSWKVCADNGSGLANTCSAVWHFTPENKPSRQLKLRLGLRNRPFADPGQALRRLSASLRRQTLRW